jgi:hypothetical protein
MCSHAADAGQPYAPPHPPPPHPDILAGRIPVSGRWVPTSQTIPRHLLRPPQPSAARRISADASVCHGAGASRAGGWHTGGRAAAFMSGIGARCRQTFAGTRARLRISRQGWQGTHPPADASSPTAHGRDARLPCTRLLRLLQRCPSSLPSVGARAWSRACAARPSRVAPPRGAPPRRRPVQTPPPPPLRVRKGQGGWGGTARCGPDPRRIRCGSRARACELPEEERMVCVRVSGFLGARV